jgi:hypothetical protein
MKDVSEVGIDRVSMLSKLGVLLATESQPR